MSLINPARLSAPIPGENFTSDERNYPWHRPPDISDLDEGIEYTVRYLTEGVTGQRYLAYIKGGVSVATVVDMVVTIGIGRGKWTPDFALLLAGPVARILMIMCKSYDIDYTLGLNITDAEEVAFINKMLGKRRNAKQEEAAEDVQAELQDIKGDAGGLMAPAAQDEQDMMLGYGPEEEPMIDEEEVA